ncbi:hypothetical protein ACHAXT_007764 [Thalassiosira profunda]
MTHHLVAIALLAGAWWWASPFAAAFTAVPSPARAFQDRCVEFRLCLTSSDEELAPSSRRSVLLQTASFLVAGAAVAGPANAGIDPSALRALPVEGDTTGVKTRLQQIESANGPRPEDSKDIAFEKLPSGASYREYREGKGDAEVQPGSKVAAEMTIRCQSFATANEPGGVKYFSTKTDTDFNELAWTVGSGELPPELEEAMMGMHKGAVRRIELPSTAVFAAKKNNQLPLPSENNKDGKRVFDRLFKTDATLLFEVLVTRIK